MKYNNKNIHFTKEERKIIETAITNDSTKKAIASTLGKDNSTIGKEIKLHRFLSYKTSYPVDCFIFAKCKNKKTA